MVKTPLDLQIPRPEDRPRSPVFMEMGERIRWARTHATVKGRPVRVSQQDLADWVGGGVGSGGGSSISDY